MVKLSITIGILLLMPSLLGINQSFLAYGQTVGTELMSAFQAGEEFLRQIEERGVAVIKDIGSFFGDRDIENNIDKAREELSTGNSEAASSTIALVDETLQNNSARISGLAQHLSNIASNQSITMDELTRQTLTEIANAFLNVSEDTDGVYQTINASLSTQ